MIKKSLLIWLAIIPLIGAKYGLPISGNLWSVVVLFTGIAPWMMAMFFPLWV